MRTKPKCGPFGTPIEHSFDSIKRGKAVCKSCEHEVEIRIIKTENIIDSKLIASVNQPQSIIDHTEEEVAASTVAHFFGRNMFMDTVSILHRDDDLGLVVTAQAYELVTL